MSTASPAPLPSARSSASLAAARLSFDGEIVLRLGVALGVGLARQPPSGRPFDRKTAVMFVLMVGVTLLVSPALNVLLGEDGLLLPSGLAGLGDAHATSERSNVELAALALLVGYSAAAAGSNAAVAFTTGARRRAFEVKPALVLMVAAAWMVWFAPSVSA